VSGPLLEVRALRGGYHAGHVLFGIDLSVDEGQVVGLLGRNGAGKSSTIKAAMGLLPVIEGERRFAGRSLAGLPPFRIAALGLGYVPEDRRVFPELTVAENLEAGRRRARDGGPGWDEGRVYVLFPQLEALRDRLGGRLSGGEQQMLAIGRALMGNPRLLLLDEPSEGLAPLVVAQIVTAVRDLRAAGLTMLVAEQNLGMVRRMADRVVVLDRGAVAYQGSLADFDADTARRDRLLALSDGPATP